jgi:hypothetical protein
LRSAIGERIEEIEYVFENGEPDDDDREELDAELANLKRLIA